MGKCRDCDAKTANLVKTALNQPGFYLCSECFSGDGGGDD